MPTRWRGHGGFVYKTIDNGIFFTPVDKSFMKMIL